LAPFWGPFWSHFSNFFMIFGRSVRKHNVGSILDRIFIDFFYHFSSILGAKMEPKSIPKPFRFFRAALHRTSTKKSENRQSIEHGNHWNHCAGAVFQHVHIFQHLASMLWSCIENPSENHPTIYEKNPLKINPKYIKKCVCEPTSQNQQKITIIAHKWDPKWSPKRWKIEENVSWFCEAFLEQFLMHFVTDLDALGIVRRNGGRPLWRCGKVTLWPPKLCFYIVFLRFLRIVLWRPQPRYL